MIPATFHTDLTAPTGCWIYSMKAAVARGRMSNSMLIAWTSFPSITWFLPALAICIIYAAVRRFIQGGEIALTNSLFRCLGSSE